MEKNKIETYLGFCIRARKIIFGVEMIERQKKGIKLLIADGAVGKNSLKPTVQAKEKFGCPLIMTDENDEIIGLTIFSRFHLNGKYEDELLLLSPVAVKTELQRQHISKELIEFGLKKAKELGYSTCIVEGNPQNYNPRGFKTSCDFGIYAHESVGLPAPECLMVIELIEGSLEHIEGEIEYSFYESLR